MGIRDGDTAEAEDVNKSYFNIFENMTPIVKYLDENNLVTSYDKLGFDSKKDSSKEYSSWDSLVSSSGYYCKKGNYTVYDDHNDGSVDTNKWSVSTTGNDSSVTEDSSGRLVVRGSDSHTSTFCSATCTSKNAITGTSFTVKGITHSHPMRGTFNIILTDGSNDIILLSFRNDFIENISYYYFTIEGTTCKIWKEGVYVDSVDINSLTSPYYIKYHVEGVTPSSGGPNVFTLYIDEEGNNDVNYQTAILESTSLLTAPDNIVSASLKKGNEDILDSNSSINYYLSNDGGDTWEQLTESERYGDRHYFNSTGNDLKFKMVLNPSSDNVYSPYSDGKDYYIQVYEK